MIDPDIHYALQRIDAGLQAKRAERINQKHERDSIARVETLFELLADEVAVYVPRTHPAFHVVLCMTVIRKMQRQQQEPEFRSELEFPNNW